jgi:hypothetical protein
MGPNPHPRRPPGVPPAREPLTHEQVDKMLRPPRGSGPQEEWVIRTTFRSSLYDSPFYNRAGGDVAYWGTRRDGTPGLTPNIHNASRYESENAALYEAYAYKEGHWIDDFIVEKLPSRPHLRSGGAGSGRA